MLQNRKVRHFCYNSCLAACFLFCPLSLTVVLLPLFRPKEYQGKCSLSSRAPLRRTPTAQPRYSTRNNNDPMRALRAPLLGNGDRSSGRPGQRLQMFLRQFGSELVSPPRPRRRSSSSTNSSNNHNNRHHNTHASIAPGDMDWSSPRSSRGRGSGGGRGGGRNGLLRVETQLSDDDDEFIDALGNSVREQRDLTAEFGSGSEANPALFASSASAAPTRRALSARADGGAAAEGVSRRRTGGAGVGVGVGGDDAGKGARASGRGGRRKWVEENPSSDGESAIEELARTRTGVDVQGEAKEINLSAFSSPSSRQGHSVSNPSFLGEGSVSAGLASETGSRLSASVGGGSVSGGHGRPSGETPSSGRGNDFRHTSSTGRDGHGAVGGQVVDGYVSLGSHNPNQQQQQRRRGSGNDRDGGLLLPGVSREGQGDGARGASGGQALSMFREQLYEEGRGRGGKGGNLASR